MSEKRHTVGSDNVHSEKFTQKHHVGSDEVQSNPGGVSTDISKLVPQENWQLSSSDVPSNSNTKHSGISSDDIDKYDQASKSLCPQDVRRNGPSEEASCSQVNELEQSIGTALGCAAGEESMESVPNMPLYSHTHHQGTESVPTTPTVTITNISDSPSVEELGLLPVADCSSLAGPMTQSSSVPSISPAGPSSYGNIAKSFDLENLETRAKEPVKSSKYIKKKCTLRPSIGSDRVLRTRSQETLKEPESNDNLLGISNAPLGGEKRNKKKRARMKQKVNDEYSRFKKHLRYLLNRISYEQNLISAYSADGWKGLSVEKLKPEKELQRATSEILRRKLKIRDLFQHLDSLCAQGRFPESLFDSEGEISSEDIFCAKCGSKDLAADNDIILCDGACDRGFHQHCLEPPLSKEEIPPGDESWLCPGCMCKVDCIDLLNDSLGTNLSINDSWEKVFPETVAGGHNQDPNFGLPSEDSEDDDYNPEAPETSNKDQQDESNSNESTSDESDFDFASDELEAPTINDQYMGPFSEDSDDEDYNPNTPDIDQEVKQESSSSDFTSDSEDLEENVSCSSLPGDSKGKISKRNETKVQSLNDELSSLLDSDPCLDGSAATSVKRSIERLDYKKLYDEAYGDVQSSSSNDENWTDAALIGEKRKIAKGRRPKGLKKETRKSKHVPKQGAHQVSNSEDQKTASVKSHEVSPCKRAMSSENRRLGEFATQILYASFKQNQYPDRSTKESLATELHLNFQQVSKWFGNARWSFKHHPSTNTTNTVSKENPSPRSDSKTKTVPKGNPSPSSDKNLDKKPLELGPKTITTGSCSEAPNNESPMETAPITLGSGEDVIDAKSTTPESIKGNSTTKSRKRKRDDDISEERALDPGSSSLKTDKDVQDAKSTTPESVKGNSTNKSRKRKRDDDISEEQALDP